MAEDKLLKLEDNVSGTLGAYLSASETASMAVSTAPTSITKGYVEVEPDTANYEKIYFSGVSGNTLTGLTRGKNLGGTGKEHQQGAAYEIRYVSEYQNGVVDALSNLVNPATGALDPTKVQPPLSKAIGAEAAVGADDSKYLTALSIANLGNNSLFRQALMNGNFDVWQRGTTVASTTGFQFLADRWETVSGVTGDTISRQAAGLNGSQYCLRYQRNAGQTNTTGLSLAQSVESSEAMKFRGKKITLSFWARKGANYSASGNALTVKVYTGTGTDQKVFSGYTGSATVIDATATLTDTWTKYTFTSANVLADTVNEFAPYFVFTPTGTAGAADYFEITQVQLNAGDVALPFMPRSFAEELDKCKRYYEPITAEGYMSSWVGMGSGYFVIAPVYSVEKRVAPSLVNTTSGNWGTGANDVQILNTRLGVNPSAAISSVIISNTNSLAFVTGTAAPFNAFVPGDGIQFVLKGGRSKLAFDAEL